MYITKQMLGPTSVRNTKMKRGSLLRQWVLSIMRKWRRRKMIAMFEALDDHILQDIGIRRGEIKHIVDGFDDRELRMNPLTPPEPATRLDVDPYRKAA